MGKEKIWRTALTVIGTAVALWLFLWLLGPVLLPFGVGLALAVATEPAVHTLQSRMKLPRWLGAGFAVATVHVSIGLILFLLGQVLCRELAAFGKALPQLTQSLAGPAETLKQRLLELAGRFPDGVGKALEEGVTSFFRSGAGLGTKAYDWVFSTASAFLKQLPTLALFLFAAVFSSFMFSAKLPQLKALWQEKAPALWKHRVSWCLSHLQSSLGGWCKAQLKLMLVIFLVLTVGFLILGIDYPVLLSLGLAVLDGLPVFGVGVVLIPWALVEFLRCHTVLGVGLLLVYGVAALLRAALEPRLLGKQIGLDPLLTLLALYAGHHFLGLGGMILFPIGAIFLKQLWSHLQKKV